MDCICASLDNNNNNYYYYIILLCFPITLSLFQPMSFTFSHSPPHPTGDVSEWLSGA